MKQVFTVLFAALLFGYAVSVEALQKRSYSMADYICHKQPNLSICKARAIRSKTTPLPFENKIDPYDPDPMPTPGPLPLDELKPESAYDVARRREQENTEDSKNALQEEKHVKQPTDSELLKSIEEIDNLSSTTSIPSEERFESTIQPEEEPHFTKFKLNPRLRYQQYQQAFQNYYQQYPSGYYNQPQNGYYNQQPYYSNPYPYQQQYYSYSYPYPSQPNGFNFGIGSQFMIPFAGPLGISSGFGFSGK